MTCCTNRYEYNLNDYTLDPDRWFFCAHDHIGMGTLGEAMMID